MQSNELLHNNNLIIIIKFSFTVLYQNDNKTKPDFGSKYQCLTQESQNILERFLRFLNQHC